MIWGGVNVVGSCLTMSVSCATGEEEVALMLAGKDTQRAS
jgi:hypothetical protein